jgi:hypothetical protein
MSVQALVAATLGKAIDRDGQFGPQCVDLVEAWIVDDLRRAPIPGNAIDLWKNADRSVWLHVNHEPLNFPRPGAVRPRPGRILLIGREFAISARPTAPLARQGGQCHHVDNGRHPRMDVQNPRLLATHRALHIIAEHGIACNLPIVDPARRRHVRVRRWDEVHRLPPLRDPARAAPRRSAGRYRRPGRRGARRRARRRTYAP